MSHSPNALLHSLKVLAACITFGGFTAISHAQEAPPQVVINEVVSANVTTLEDEDGDAEDWLELHNSGSTAATLTGWGLSDDLDEPFKWTFPALTLAPGEYLVIWTSGKDRLPDTSDQPLHTNFSISAGGESLILTTPGGETHDRVDVPALRSDIAFGRDQAGGDDLFYFAQATPGVANTSESFIGVLEAPELSAPAGFYTTAVEVSATHSTNGVSLHYTLDGGNPATSSPTFDAPLSLDSRRGEPNDISSIPTATGTGYWGWNGPPAAEVFKINTLRVRAFKAGYIPSPAVTASYLIDPAIEDRYTLPVISLVTDNTNLFDTDTGLFVNENYLERGREWEREVHFELFVDQESELSLDMGMRIHGGQSRLAALKSLRLYARSEYGTGEVEYPLFPDKPGQDVFETFLLRSGGNNWASLPFRDALATSLIKDVSTVDVQYYRPTAVFINGEYWGMLALRDRFDDKYIEHHYDIEEIDMLEGRVADEGTTEHYDALMDFMATHDVSTAENYAEIGRRMDLENFRDYFIAQTYTMNVDQPANNVRLWRSQTVDPANPYADGRWRWLLYDVDLSMSSLGGSLEYMTAQDRNALIYNTNLDYFGAPTVNGNPTWGDTNDPNDTFPLRTLLGNETFRLGFINRFADLLNSAFSANHVVPSIDRFAEAQRPDIDEHMARWYESREFWEGQVAHIKTFAEQRPAFVRQHLIDFFGLAGQATLTVDANASRGKVQVNTLIIDGDTPGLPNPAAPYPWSGTYFQGIPLSLIAIPEPGYAFSHWEGISGAVAQEDAVTFTPTASPQNFTAVFVETEQAELLHYWNFNDSDTLLDSAAGTTLANGSISITLGEETEIEDDDGQDFVGANARLGTPVGNHLRLNNPLGATVTLNLPTTGFEDVVLRYETRRSGKGAGTQVLSYTTDGVNWAPLGSVPVPDGTPTVVSYDFSEIDGTANNPRFAVNILFEQGSGNDGGNNRFDNLSLEGLPSDLPPPFAQIGFQQPQPLVGEINIIAEPGDLIPLQALISDPQGEVASVVFQVDDTLTLDGQSGAGSTWSASLDTTAFAYGAYTIQAQALDAAGQPLAASSITLEVLSNLAALQAGLPSRPDSFPAAAYLARHDAVQASVGSFINRADLAWQHYWLEGIDAGLTFSDDFHPTVYLGLYGDLRAYFDGDQQMAALHWLLYGQNEGRLGNIPPTFDVEAYLARHADLRAYFGDDHVGVFLHYLNYGVFEGRVLSDDFHADDYLLLNPDLQAAFGHDPQAAVLHWLLIGKTEGRPGRLAFGTAARSYLERYPDLQAVFGDNIDLAFEHYLAHGIGENRIFDEDFRPAEYLARYPDLREAFGDDLETVTIHWYAFGQREGRLGRF